MDAETATTRTRIIGFSCGLAAVLVLANPRAARAADFATTVAAHPVKSSLNPVSAPAPVPVGTGGYNSLSGATPPATAILSVSPASRDFGAVTIGQTGVRTFTVSNLGSATLTGTASAGAPFVVSGGRSFSVAGGASATVTVSFSPVAAINYSGKVDFASNGGSASAGVTGSGLTPAQLLVAPGHLNFGMVEAGLKESAILTVSNAGGTLLTGAVSVGTSRFTLSTNRLNLAGFASTTLTVFFKPLAAGVYSNSVVFTGNGGGGSVPVRGQGVEAPVAQFSATPTNGFYPFGVAFTDASTGTITNRVWTFGDGDSVTLISGSPSHTYTSAGVFTVRLEVSGPLGTDSLERTDYIAVAAPPPALLQVLPAGLDFGAILTGTTAQASFTVTNAGYDLMTGSVSVAAGPFAAETNRFSLAGFAATSLVVRFAPVAVGAYTQAVAFSGNGGALSIPVTGTGQPGPSVLRLKAATYSGMEGGKVKVVVLREGGLQGAVSVSFQTKNGTALMWDDYMPVSKVLSWADGDGTPRSVRISLLADGLAEAKENFKVRLGTPTGASLGVPSIAKVVILPPVGSAPLGLAGAAAGASFGAEGMSLLTAALDGEGLTWFTSADAPWLAGADETAAGGTAAMGAAVAAGAVSWLQTEVEGPGRLAFNWLAGPGGRCLFLDNGFVRETLEAGSEWGRATMETGPGRHVLMWVVPGETVPGTGPVLLDRVLWLPE